jgi:hypothetical protein
VTMQCAIDLAARDASTKVADRDFFRGGKNAVFELTKRGVAR